MAFARSVQKAAKINKLTKILRQEKEYSAYFACGTKGKISSRFKLRHTKFRFRRKIGMLFKKIFPLTEGTKINIFFYKLRKDGSYENFTFKSLVGFVSGFFLTYLFFMIFIFQLNLKFGKATVMCSVIGGILTIGLAFSYKVRCIVLLLLPTCFSKRGRQALLAYAFILSLTGPAKNTLNNMRVLNESLSCGQEQLKEALKQITDAIKEPLYAIKDALKTVIKTLKNIIKKIKEILLAIKRIILSIINVFKAAFQFLAKIFRICNKEVGTPFERCSRAFEDAITDCNAKLGPYFSWLCSITYLIQGVCHVVKRMDFICILVDCISNSVVGAIIRKIKNFVRRIKTMFYVRLRFSHSFHFETNQTMTTMNEVTAGIATEFKNRTQRLVQIFDIMSCAASFFFVLAVIKVIYYRHKFLTSETFDNRYITQDFRQLDMRRAQLEVETVLPLNHRERKKYVSSTSIRLINSEKKKLSKAAMTVFIATVKMTVYILIDYALFWTLKMIRYHAIFQSKVKAPNMPTLQITGNGFIAKLLRSVATAFQPIGMQIEIDTIPCLPDPIPPDYDRYIQIASCIVLCWILAILEPYGLRMRHCVMCYYHPLRAKERAIWLFNHIQSARRSFLKFARRQLRRKVMGDKRIGKEVFNQFLVSHLIDRCPCLKSFKKIRNVKSCLLCEEMLQSKPSTIVRCQTPGCPGIYCQLCYNDLKNVCTICQDPLEYGDYSDIDEEKDSSDNKTSTKVKSKKGRNDSDKDSKDSESSTSGYSDSYQTSTRRSNLDLIAYSTPSGDLEKQDLPTYASMQAFFDPEPNESGSPTRFSKSSRSSRSSRRRSKERSKRPKSSQRHSSKKDKQSNKRTRQVKRRKPRDENSQDLLELGMYPLRDKPKEEESRMDSERRVKLSNKLKQKSRSSITSDETERSTSSPDSANNSDEYPGVFKMISPDSTDLSSPTDTSIITELKPLKTKKRAREQTKKKVKYQTTSLFTYKLKTPTITSKKSSNSSQPRKILNSLFRRTKAKSSKTSTSEETVTSSDETSESEYHSEFRPKLVDRSSDSSLITELQERIKLINRATDVSSSDELLLEVKNPKPKFLKHRRDTPKSKSTQFSNTVSVGTRISQPIPKEHHPTSTPLAPSPPPLPPSLQSSPQSKPKNEDNTKPTRIASKKSITRTEREVKEHLRGGEDIPMDNLKKFLSGPKRFRLPTSQPKTFSPMKSLSNVISELKEVLGEECFRSNKEYKLIDNMETIPLPPIPTSLNQESERTAYFIPEKSRGVTKSYETKLTADEYCHLSQKIIAGPCKISPTADETKQEINTSILSSCENHDMPTVRERIRAFEAAFGIGKNLDDQSSMVSTTDLIRNEDSQFDIYFTPQNRKPFQFRERSRYQVPHLDLISDHERSYITSRTSHCTSPDKIVDHYHCQCDLPKKVLYKVERERDHLVNRKCKCRRHHNQ